MFPRRLPPGYDGDGSAHYPVVYMHDGQNRFDPATPYAGVDRAIDEILTDLIDSGGARPALPAFPGAGPRRAA